MSDSIPLDELISMLRSWHGWLRAGRGVAVEPHEEPELAAVIAGLERLRALDEVCARIFWEFAPMEIEEEPDCVYQAWKRGKEIAFSRATENPND